MTLAHPLDHGVETDPAFGPLKQYIIDATGLAYYLDKDVELAGHITRRLNVLRIEDCAAYLNRLVGEPSGEQELDALTRSLTIGETFFFRHQEFFDALRDRVFPQLIARNQEQQRLRIWSAGCANGAEPYSLAIMLAREFGTQLADWDVSVVGSDINRDFLAQAERGEFGSWSLRALSEELKAACFARASQAWVIKKIFRRRVSFQYHNLVKHHFPSLSNGLSGFDLILCRNVMIYFDTEVVERLVNQFHESLVDEGWFAVGPTEPSVNVFRSFETVNLPGVTLYQKRPASTNAPVATRLPPLGANVFSPAHKPAALARLACDSMPGAVCANDRQVAHVAIRQSAARNAAAPTTLADVRLQLNRGESAAAGERCRVLLAADRLNPHVHFYHALAAGQQGRYAESEQALRRAIYLDRDLVLAHYYLGLVLHRNHDRPAAQRSFQNVLQLLHQRDGAEAFADEDGLTVEDLRQLTEMHLEVLERT